MRILTKIAGVLIFSYSVAYVVTDVVMGVAAQKSAVAPAAEQVNEVELADIPSISAERTPIVTEVTPPPPQVQPTPMGLFEPEEYPFTCFPTEENFRERYARSLRELWNMPVLDFIYMMDSTDFNEHGWHHKTDLLRAWVEDNDGDVKVGYLLSLPGDVDFEQRLTDVWNSPNVFELYKRHMEVIEISTWTAAVDFQGDINYVGTLNNDMLDYIRTLIWDNDPDLEFLWAVQKHKEYYE